MDFRAGTYKLCDKSYATQNLDGISVEIIAPGAKPHDPAVSHKPPCALNF